MKSFYATFGNQISLDLFLQILNQNLATIVFVEMCIAFLSSVEVQTLFIKGPWVTIPLCSEQFVPSWTATTGDIGLSLTFQHRRLLFI